MSPNWCGGIVHIRPGIFFVAFFICLFFWQFRNRFYPFVTKNRERAHSRRRKNAHNVRFILARQIKSFFCSLSPIFFVRIKEGEGGLRRLGNATDFWVDDHASGSGLTSKFGNIFVFYYYYFLRTRPALKMVEEETYCFWGLFPFISRSHCFPFLRDVSYNPDEHSIISRNRRVFILKLFLQVIGPFLSSVYTTRTHRGNRLWGFHNLDFFFNSKV